ncbi:MAG: hypothetical protein U1E93_13100 [Alphaproteobacteria bacterium]
MEQILKPVVEFFHSISILPVIAIAIAAIAVRASVEAFQTMGILKPLPISHKIAVIGLPTAGKTTLITGLFELIQRGVHIKSVKLHGVKTISLINRNISRLESGQVLDPTTEKDIFVFRFSYLLKRLPFKLLYDVEIADFPGEYSEQIFLDDESDEGDVYARKRRDKEFNSFSSEEVLFKREFFSWIATSSKYLFVIDLAALYSSESPRAAIAEISARVRTSWQIIEDAVSERSIGDLSKRSVQIVFTKVDSLMPVFVAGYSLADLVQTGDSVELDRRRDEIGIGVEDCKQAIKNEGRRRDLSEVLPISGDLIARVSRENDVVFSDLTQFFKAHAKDAGVIYVSMRLHGDDGARLGVKNVLKAILPGNVRSGASDAVFTSVPLARNQIDRRREFKN